MPRRSKKINRPLTVEVLLICELARKTLWDRLAKQPGAGHRAAHRQDLFESVLSAKKIDRLVELGFWPPTKKMEAVVLRPPGEVDAQQTLRRIRLTEDLYALKNSPLPVWQGLFCVAGGDHG